MLVAVNSRFSNALSAVCGDGTVGRSDLYLHVSGCGLTYMHQQQPFCSLMTTIRRMLLYIGSWNFPLVYPRPGDDPFWLLMVPC